MPRHTRNKIRIDGKPAWRNSTKTLTVKPQKYFTPKKLKDIEDIVQRAITESVPVRAVGSGHSFSKAPEAKGFLIDMDQLCGLKPYEYSLKERHYEVDAGMKIHDLNEELDKKGLAITTMGGIDHQSISGAISTGTHGSSLDFGAISKMVKSIVLVTQNPLDPSKSETIRIEPRHGITNIAKYNGPRLVQDDDLFNAALVCFGTMGIIASLVVEVEPLYYLKEEKKLIDWPNLKTKLRSREVFDDAKAVFTLTNPYYFEGKRQAMVVHHRVRPKPSNTGSLGDRINKRSRSLAFSLASLFPAAMWYVVAKVNFKPESVPKLLSNALKSQKDDKYFNKGYKVMYQGLDYIKERGLDCEMAIEMDAAGDYLDTVDALMDYIEQLKAQDLVITSPIGLRFVKGSDAFMTPESGRDTVYIDVPILIHTKNRKATVNHIQQFLLARGARPHWGKLNDPLTQAHVENLYPHYDRFMAIMKRYNPQQLFSNDFTKRVLGW